MLKLVCVLLVLVPLGCAQVCDAEPKTVDTGNTGAGSGKWSLAWSDEFDGKNGSPVDSSKWGLDIGGDGWGNNELQTYTDRTSNVRLEKGKLIITAEKERFTGVDGLARDFTSARLLTKGRFSQRFGRFEARIKIPYGRGIWPAFWLLGDDVKEVGIPRCGEIDVMENVGHDPTIVYGTLHGPGYSANRLTSGYMLGKGRKFSQKFHVYAVEWEPDVIRFFVDKKLFRTLTPNDLPQDATWVFDQPYFILLNIAVGGDWPGNPDLTTRFPQKMEVDWVRVYKK